MKFCSKCSGEFPLALFYKNSALPDGKCRMCKVCTLADVNARHDRQRAERRATGWLPRAERKPVKRFLDCDVCGEETRTPVTSGRSSARHNKCSVLVACGTATGYKHHRCRCVKCRAWNVASSSAYRAQRRESGDPIQKRTSWCTGKRRLEIYARDGWICQICFVPIDNEEHWSSDWAASLDHIVPVSHGGGNESENLRMAHRWCNCVRSDARRTDEEIAQEVLV